MIQAYVPHGIYEWCDKYGHDNIRTISKNWYFVTSYGWVTEAQLNYLVYGGTQ